MDDTVNLTAAAELLGISLPTARKRIAASYKGDGKIKGATRIGRDWLIPRSEVARLAAAARNRRTREFQTTDAVEVATNAWLSLAGDNYREMDAAVRDYSTATRRAGPYLNDPLAVKEITRKIQRLTDAVRAHEELSVMVKLIRAMRQREDAEGARIRSIQFEPLRPQPKQPRVKKKRRGSSKTRSEP